MSDDTRPRVNVDKPLDLAALDVELGGVGLCAALDDAGNVVEVVAADGSDVTQTQLADAVKAHQPPEADPDPVDVARAKVAKLPEGPQRDALTAVLDVGAGQARSTP